MVAMGDGYDYICLHGIIRHTPPPPATGIQAHWRAITDPRAERRQLSSDTPLSGLAGWPVRAPGCRVQAIHSRWYRARILCWLRRVCQLRPARRHLPLAAEHPEVVDCYVADEMAEGRILGPFPGGTIPSLHTNRLGVIPKRHTPGKWRLIIDFSYPARESVTRASNPSCAHCTIPL